MSAETSAPKDPNTPIVIDLGKKKRGRVKKLRKGGGPLMDDINESVNELRDGDTISKDAQVVVVVVKEKKKKMKGYPFSLL